MGKTRITQQAWETGDSRHQPHLHRLGAFKAVQAEGSPCPSGSHSLLGLSLIAAAEGSFTPVRQTTEQPECRGGLNNAALVEQTGSSWDWEKVETKGAGAWEANHA